MREIKNINGGNLHIVTCILMIIICQLTSNRPQRNNLNYKINLKIN